MAGDLGHLGRVRRLHRLLRVEGGGQVGFGDYTANLNKQNGLVIKRGSDVVYDDREIAQEKCNPGEWLNEFTFFLALEAEKKRRILRRKG